MEVKKMFYTMGEVAEMLDVNSSLIRHWEKYFSILKPTRNKKGNRLFSPKDVDNLKQIYHLVKERGMTLEGAQRSLSSSKMPVSREAELMERLLNIRSLLVEVREDLKGGDVEPSSVNDSCPPTDDDSDESVVIAPLSSSAAPKHHSGDVSQEKELFAFYEQKLF